jgi:two-component system chemotaxis sensor kinase CheA
MAQDRYKYFRIEARELVDELGKGVLGLEKAGDAREHVPRLLRLAHTLKGAARVVKQAEIADGAHAVEDVLTQFRESGVALPRESIDALLALLDQIGARLKTIDGGAPQKVEPAAPNSAPKLPAASDTIETVRTGIADVEAVLEGIAETHAQMTAIKRTLQNAERARSLVDVLAEHVHERSGREEPQSSGDDAVRSLAADLRGFFAMFERSLTRAVEHMDRELTEVREKAERLRLVPAATLFVSLERTARDTALSLGKAVAFEARGGAIRLDAHVLEGVQQAMIQLVRNAVAHGIEPAPERERAGKDPAGRVEVEVLRRGSRVVFRTSDDGRGLDLEAVRRAAARRGTPAEALEKLRAEELFQLLLQGGISTSARVTELAGRGVGLDVARAAMVALRGDVTLQTGAGTGSTFELSVPLSVASVEALVAGVSGRTVRLPLDAVRHTARLSQSAISRTPTGATIVHLGEAIPFVPLADILQASAPLPLESRPTCAVILSTRSGRAALGVDELRGTAHAILRPLPELAPAAPIIAGATLDAEGNPELMLDPESLIAEALRSRGPSVEHAAPSLPVLVIDDSLTTRMLEQSILESAGYTVDVATSAEQGLEKARAARYALFLVDVEMPGMDGFGFIEHIRKDPELSNIPAILVTSRASPEDRERGRNVGANGYVVKSEFDQNDLLARIKRLVA